MIFRDQLRTALRVRHYAIATEKSYCSWGRKFILFHKKRHPKDMGAPEVVKLLSHLAVNRTVAASTQNQALCAIVFLYIDSFGHAINPLTKRKIFTIILQVRLLIR
jgi:hypothetical protein